MPMQAWRFMWYVIFACCLLLFVSPFAKLSLLLPTCGKILFENRFKNDINNDCLLSVDGTDFQRSQTNKDWYSHKFKRSGLFYEVAILILGGDICWICGPWRPGVYNDLMIFCESLATWLEPGE
jgi:hypothetical protein